MQTIVPVKTNGEFSKDHLEIVKSLLRKEAFPQFFTNEEFKSLKFIGVELIPAELIIRDALGEGSSQSPRRSGLNPEYPRLKTDILENGWRLYEKPIFVKRTGQGGKFSFVDGRTKDKILNEKKFKNRICVIVEINEDDEEDFSERLNAGEDSSPAGLVKEEDILYLARKKIEKGTLELDVVAIRSWMDKCLGKGKFSGQKRNDLTYQIFHHNNALQTSNRLPVSWANTLEVQSWLIRHNYIETDNVVYLPYAASSPMKAVFAAAKLSQEKPGKQIRVVVYVSKMNAYDLKKCYLDAVLKFKHNWFHYMSMLGNVYYGNADSNSNKVLLYGYVPSNIEDVCENMEKVIVIGKTDQKINDNYLTSQTLSNLFDVCDEDAEDDGE